MDPFYDSPQFRQTPYKYVNDPDLAKKIVEECSLSDAFFKRMVRRTVILTPLLGLAVPGLWMFVIDVIIPERKLQSIRPGPLVIGSIASAGLMFSLFYNLRTYKRHRRLVQ